MFWWTLYGNIFMPTYKNKIMEFEDFLFIVVALVLAVILVYFLIWLLPVILVVIVAYIIYKLLKVNYR